jgi:predicted transcriptional regulator of viral defense system
MESSSPSHILRRLKRRAAKVLRARELEAMGVPRWRLKGLVEDGHLIRTGRGLYTVADSEITENHTLAEAAKRVPRGVVCLLSALRFHGLTTENPWQVWIAVNRVTRMPKADYPPLRVVKLSEPFFSAGIETHTVEGVPVRVYGVAKTLADCFKHRSKVGINVAREALRDAWKRRMVKPDEILKAASICRVEAVMKPYLDAYFEGSN